MVCWEVCGYGSTCVRERYVHVDASTRPQLNGLPLLRPQATLHHSHVHLVLTPGRGRPLTPA